MRSKSRDLKHKIILFSAERLTLFSVGSLVRNSNIVQFSPRVLFNPIPIMHHIGTIYALQ